MVFSGHFISRFIEVATWHCPTKLTCVFLKTCGGHNRCRLLSSFCFFFFFPPVFSNVLGKFIGLGIFIDSNFLSNYERLFGKVGPEDNEQEFCSKFKKKTCHRCRNEFPHSAVWRIIFLEAIDETWRKFDNKREFFVLWDRHDNGLTDEKEKLTPSSENLQLLVFFPSIGNKIELNYQNFSVMQIRQE